MTDTEALWAVVQILKQGWSCNWAPEMVASVLREKLEVGRGLENLNQLLPLFSLWPLLSDFSSFVVPLHEWS